MMHKESGSGGSGCGWMDGFYKEISFRILTKNQEVT